MVTTCSQHAKREKGFSSLPSLLNKIKARDKKAPVPKPAKKPAAVHDYRLRKSFTEGRTRRRERAKRLRSLILGRNRVFKGSIHIPDPFTARQTDAQRLSSIRAMIDLGIAIVYWVDGSACQEYLGAGVVWQDKYNNISAQYKLGRYTGCSEDAEIFAIAAALGRARKEVERNRHIRIVKIFSDAQSVLQALGKGTLSHFGPMLAKKTALEGLYERTDTLTAQGVAVELVWVKGHAESEGNRLADHAADDAVTEQIELGGGSSGPERTTPATLTDVPQMWREMSHDWVEEWLYCANVHLHHSRTKRQGVRSKPLTVNDHGHPQKASQQSRKAPAFEHRSSTNVTQSAFTLPNLGLYGNLTLDQIIDDLCNQRELVDYQISEVKRLIANATGEKVVEYLKSKVAELFVERDSITEAIEAQLVVQRLGNQIGADEEAIMDEEDIGDASEEEIGTADEEEVEEEQWAGDLLLVKLDTLLVADDQLGELDTDEELERQIREDIALASRLK